MMADISKAFGVAGILLFFMIISYFSILLEDYSPGNIEVSNFDSESLTNVTAQDTGVFDTSVLSIWDYLFRFLDVITVGVVFFASGLATTLINLFIMFPLRIILIWLIVELFRGV